MSRPMAPVLRVSEVTTHIKTLIESDLVLVDIGVRGEVSNCKHHASGHIYFTLKDEASQIQCVMFRQDAVRLDFRPADGLEVTCYGRVRVYESQGRYQLYVTAMEAGGTGALFEAFERLKRRLEAEGLFAPSARKALPRFPRRIGVISTLSGAGLRDMLTILARRYPPAHVCVVPTLVQGAEAPAQLIRAVKLADARGRFDVIIIGRGGGSIEDLWCFNDEGLARAIHACRTPVVSAVGHETDFTICDFVADLRAPTPSAAAEMVVPDRVELLAQTDDLAARLRGGLLRRSEVERARLSGLSARRVWSHPLDLTADWRIRIDELHDRATTALGTRIERDRARLDRATASLRALSPMHVLSRGYAIARRREDGRVVRTVRDAPVGTDMRVLVSDGGLDAAVTGVREGSIGQGS